MATIEHIKDFKITSDQKFFFDNNVWMLLFSSGISNSRSPEQSIYSRLFRDIQTAGGTIFINSLIASEYVNSNLRLAFERWSERQRTGLIYRYKRDYIPTVSYNSNRQAVYAELAEILKISYKKSDDFNAIKIENLESIGRKMDFNDAYYAEYCKINNLILVTDDKDLFDCELDITILTR